MTEHTTFIRLYTADGAYYHLDASSWNALVSLVTCIESPEWTKVLMVGSKTELYIRTDEIQSFYISTPEHRALVTEWEKMMNTDTDEEKEPWQQ